MSSHLARKPASHSSTSPATTPLCLVRPPVAVYSQSGNQQVQGISVGWNDVYSSGLGGQQINITGVANGDYWLEVTVDPLNSVQESDDTNNTTRIPITLTGLPTTGFRVYSSTPLGANNNPVSYVELNFSQAVNVSTFTASDVTFNGPSGNIPITGITAVSSTQFRVNFATQAAVGTYTMNVGPNISTTTGALLDTNNNGTGGEAADVFNNIFAITAPRIVTTSPAAAANPPLSSVHVTFNKPMNSSTFTTADIFQFTGPSGASLVGAITGIVPITTGGLSAEFDINFAPQSALGAYTLVIEPTILDSNGASIDQNDNPADSSRLRYPRDIRRHAFGRVLSQEFKGPRDCRRRSVLEHARANRGPAHLQRPHHRIRLS